MKKLLLATLFAASTVSYLEAATASIGYTKDFVEETDLLTSIENSGGADVSKWHNTWCDNAVLSANGHTVNVYIDDVFNAPAPAGTNNGRLTITMGGLNLTIKEGGVLSNMHYADDYTGEIHRGNNLNVENGNVITVDGKIYANNYNANYNTGSSLIVRNLGSVDFVDRSRIGLTTSTGVNLIRLEGSKVSASFQRISFVGGTDTTVENVLGGKLEFVADADGISTITNIGAVEAFSGVVEADFTNLKWNDEWTGDDHTFTLLSATDNSSLLNDWVVNYATTNGNIKGANGDFWADNKNLYVTITKDSVIPEPSTYAAIFGAVALAFVAYRRRK